MPNAVTFSKAQERSPILTNRDVYLKSMLGIRRIITHICPVDFIAKSVVYRLCRPKSLIRRRKRAYRVGFFKHIDLDNVEQELRRGRQIQVFASDDDNEIDADGDPNLRLDGIDGVAEKMFDRQVLFDPFEKGLDRPSVAVDVGDGQCGQIESIGQKDKELVGFGITVRDTAQAIRVGKLRFGCGQQDALVAAQPGRFVDLAPGDPGVTHIVLGPDDEGDLLLMQCLPSGEIEIAAVDEYDGYRRPMNHVEDLDVVHLAGGDMDENGNGASQIDNRVRLDGRLGRAEVRPRKQTQTQVDSGGIHGIEGFLDAQSNIFALIEFDGGCNQSMTERFKQSPIAAFVGVGQRGAGDLAANPDVVELGTLRIETSHQIAQTFPTCQLGIRDAEEMCPRRKVTDAMVRGISIDEMLEMTEGDEVQQLRKHRPATIHDLASFANKNGKDTVKSAPANSNRRNLGSRQNSLQF